VNLFDLVIVVAVIGAAVGGYRLGFLARVTSWIGLGIGLYVAARFLPRIVNALLVSDSAGRLLLAAGVLIGGAFVGQALGLLAGGRLHSALPYGALRDVDRGVGAGVGMLGVVMAIWLLLPAMSVVPGWPSHAATHSTISQWVSAHLPRPPNALQTLRRLVGDNTFPQVFSALHQGESLGTPPFSSGLSPAVTTRVMAATVKVEGEACNRIQDGSGFAVAPDTIVTNAHVVAGEPKGKTHVQVSTPTGNRTLAATVVLFDPDVDLAILRVDRLGEFPLAITSGGLGDVGAVFGHPGGEDRVVIAPARVSRDVTAIGRDLYDNHETKRDVFVLAATLHPGDSGGPLVNATGSVIGVAFAIAPDQSGTAYALTSKELLAELDRPQSIRASTGACLTS
jgi:S1-C subfamily serine protease